MTPTRRAATPARLTDPTDVLGECPIWREDENALYWIDVRGRAIRRLALDDRTRRDWSLPEMIGSWAFSGQGGALVALESEIARLDLATGALGRLAAPHEGARDMRFNDGRCDPKGRFWVGSMNDATRKPVGRLYRIDAAGCEAVMDRVAVPNSLCWSHDGGAMYFSDGREPVIFAFDYDLETGTPSNRREFARLEAGAPDGATVDSEGCVWCAVYGAGALHRYAPDGALVERIGLPFSQPTHCAFGGLDRATLYVTSARQKLAPERLAAEPGAGAVFALDVGARGAPEPRFAY